ncbi:MAG: ABC transporter substrate-binding protein [Pseudomonadota bacterium]
MTSCENQYKKLLILASTLILSLCVTASYAATTGKPCYEQASIPQNTFSNANPQILLQDITNKQLLPALKACQSELKKGSTSQRNAVVYGIVSKFIEPYIDLDSVSSFIAGPQWRHMSQQERQRFTKAIIKVMVNAYSSAVATADPNQIKIQYGRSSITGANKNRATVSSMITQEKGRPPVAVDYRLAKINNEWKLTDLTVAGVSTSQSYHSQVQAYFQQGNSITKTIEWLEKAAARS